MLFDGSTVAAIRTLVFENHPKGMASQVRGKPEGGPVTVPELPLDSDRLMTQYGFPPDYRTGDTAVVQQLSRRTEGFGSQPDAIVPATDGCRGISL